MVEIYPGLFIGNESDYEMYIKNQAGWWIVHACKEPYHRQLLGYKSRGAPKDHPEYFFAERANRLFLNLVDTEDAAYIHKHIIDKSLQFINKALQTGDKVLVHCNQGESRSPVIGLLYLGIYTNAFSGLTLSEAEAKFRQLYPAYNPKRGMKDFLHIHWYEYIKTKDS
jgi:protein-tyrosine phosphatase